MRAIQPPLWETPHHPGCILPAGHRGRYCVTARTSPAVPAAELTRDTPTARWVRHSALCHHCGPADPTCRRGQELAAAAEGGGQA